MDLSTQSVYWVKSFKNTIGSDITLPIIHEANTKPLLSGIVPSNEIIAAREELMAYAEPLY